MTFEEQFPSLKDYTTTCECGSIGSPRHPEDDVVFVPVIQEHCLDKQIVREAIEEAFQEASSFEGGQIQKEVDLVFQHLKSRLEL